MKTLLSILTLLLVSNFTTAQTTAIPDANFEQALINLGYDSGPIDGVILTVNINTIDSLYVPFQSISDLTGIEDFSALTKLMCYNNLLTSLNITQNTNLTNLRCSSNQITSLDITQNTGLISLDFTINQISSIDVTQNTALTFLYCSTNQLTSINVTQNTALKTLWCALNQITSIDLTQNIVLTDFNCQANQISNLNITQNTALSILNCHGNQLSNLNVTQQIALTELACGVNQLTNINLTQNIALIELLCQSNQLQTLNVANNTSLTTLNCYGNIPLACLNVKNGNYLNFVLFRAYNNPNLTCIEVDDITFSNTNWSTIGFHIDAGDSFSTNCNNSCSTVGVIENNLSNVSLYPNPTSSSINIYLGETKSNINLRVTNTLGQVVLTQNHKSTKYLNFDLNTPKGVYFLRLESDGEVITKTIIKE